MNPYSCHVHLCHLQITNENNLRTPSPAAGSPPSICPTWTNDGKIQRSNNPKLPMTEQPSTSTSITAAPGRILFNQRLPLVIMGLHSLFGLKRILSTTHSPISSGDPWTNVSKKLKFFPEKWIELGLFLGSKLAPLSFCHRSTCVELLNGRCQDFPQIQSTSY